MATTRELSEELDQHIGSIRTSMEDIDRTVRTNTEAIARTRTQRKERMRAYAFSLLPNLSPATFQALSLRVTGFIGMAEAQAQIEREEGVFQRQIERHLTAFKPATYAAQQSEININLGCAREDHALARETFQELGAIDGLERLIDNGYGTSTYPHHWWNLQYYTDWRDADNAVEAAHVTDWDALRQQYRTMKNDVETHRRTIETYERELRELNEAHTRYDELIAAKDKVPQVVLEQLQTRLQAGLEGLEPIPAWMGDVQNMNASIARYEAENTDLQSTRAQLARDLVNLQGVKTKVMRSGRREVPDDYLTRLKQSGRHNRQTAASGRTVSRSPSPASSYPGTTHVHHHHHYSGDTSFYDALLFTELSHHYEREEPRPSYGGWGSGGSNYSSPHRRDDGYSGNHGRASSGVDYTRQS